MPSVRSIVRRIYRAALPLIFARRTYKFLLRTSILDVDTGLRRLALATDFFANHVRPIPIRAPFGRSVLVVAPHQDDEIIGCGGALLLHVRAGGHARVMVLQDGADEHAAFGISRTALSALRNAESSAVASSVGIPEPRFLGLADLAGQTESAAQCVREEILEHAVDTVFVPFVLDAHPDHRLANRIVAAALRSLHDNVRVLGYEVWGSCIPNVIVVIDDVADEKRALLDLYTYANRAVDYVGSSMGLAMYRSRLLPAGAARHAECFFELPGAEYVALVSALDADG